MESLMQAYIDSTLTQDPVFMRVRQRFYNSNENWLDIAGFLFQKTLQKISGFKAQTLLPALGWEFRSGLEPGAIGVKKWESLLGALRAQADWDVCQITCLTPEEVLGLEQAAKKSGFVLKAFEFPIRFISGNRSYQDYLKARSSNRNKVQRSLMRKAAQEGLEFKTELTWDEIEQLLEVRTGKFSAESDYTRSREFRGFLKEVRASLKKDGRWSEEGVYKNGKLIGYDLGFYSGRVFKSYQTAYHPEYAAFRAGHLAFEKRIESVLNVGTDLIDLMGDNPYFELFTREVLPFKRVMIFSPVSWKGRALSFLYGIKARLKK